MICAWTFSPVPVRAEAADVPRKNDTSATVRELQDRIASQGATPARLYNLGVAHYRNAGMGPAILAWEKASLLDPRDADLRENLKLARQKAGTAVPPASFIQDLLQRVSLGEWSWLVLLTGSAAAILAVLLALGKMPAHARRAAFSGIAACVLLSTLSLLALRSALREGQQLIATAETPVLRLSPFAEAGKAASLKPGTRLIPEKQLNDWTWATVAATGQQGWIAKADAAPVLDDTPPAWLAW